MLNRAGKRLQSWIAPVYAAMFLAITAICILFPHIKFGRASLTRQFLPWPILLALGAVFCLGLYVVCGRMRKTPIRGRYLLLGSLLLLAVQIIAVYQYYFLTDWDIPRLIDVAVITAHRETFDLRNIHYFSHYPNNLFLGWLFSLIVRAMHLLGLHNGEYFSILIVQCVINTAVGVLVFRILEKLFQDGRIAVFGWLIYFLMIGISPWVSIPYSDSIGLLFPTLILYLYLNRDRAAHRWIPWTAIGFLAIIGYQIKPQILILFLALGIVKFLQLLRTGRPARYLRNLAGVAAGIACAVLLSNWAVSSLNIPIDRESTYGIRHFFMMGMNPNDYGVWSEEDVTFSGSFKTVAERDEADMQRALERIREMGPVGIAKLLVRKTLTNYYDGTFCWSGEGSFFQEILPEKNPALSRFFRGLYYTRSQSGVGVHYAAWANFEQMLWATTLLFSVFAVRNRKRTEDRDLIMLAIIGLTVFELIFEARARYLFAYAPLYIILAMYGWSACADGLKRKQFPS